MPTPTSMPETLGRYRIVRKVGEGGMGAVYLAEDTFLGRAVALKVPHFSDKDSPATSERFLREARAAAVLIHPDICPILDAGEVEGVFFLTMPFVDGQPLSCLLGGGDPWPVDRACALVRRLALAVGALHQRGLVHRDLKPGNVMVRPGGEPMLMDFGLARSFTSQSQRLTASGATVGTPAYMAPEQVRGEADAIGPATDVYALGVILYELLTGSLPFEGPPALVYGQILHAEATAVTLRRPDLDPRLESVCRRAMAKAPADRFAGVADLAAALEPFLSASAFLTPDAATVPVAAFVPEEQHPTADYKGEMSPTRPNVPASPLASDTVPQPLSTTPAVPSALPDPPPRKRVSWVAVVAAVSTVAAAVLVVILLNNKRDPEPTPEDLLRLLPREFKITFPSDPGWGGNLGAGGAPVTAFFGNSGGKDPSFIGIGGAGGAGGMMSGNSGATFMGNLPGIQGGGTNFGTLGVGGGFPNQTGFTGGGDLGLPKQPDFPPFPKP